MCLGAVVLLLTRTFVVQVFIMLRDSEDSSRLRIQTLQPRLEEEVQDTEAYPKQSFLICILSEGSLSVRCRQRRRGASTDGRRSASLAGDPLLRPPTSAHAAPSLCINFLISH